ncbi:MAG: hypothetical protein WBM14_14860 [Terracidiphilus sp.]|jgi:hypothetical protein
MLAQCQAKNECKVEKVATIIFFGITLRSWNSKKMVRPEHLQRDSGDEIVPAVRENA